MNENHEWEIVYNEYDSENQHLRESLCTLGNGYFASRGAFEFAEASYDFKNNPHYPGTYLAGVFNQLKSTVSDKEIANESIVNWPNWLYLTFENAERQRFTLEDVHILDFKEQLDLKQGQLNTQIKFRDQQARESSLNSRRLISMDDRHLSLLEWEFQALNWSGEISIISGIDGRVKNKGVPRYNDLNGDHLDILEQGEFGNDGLFMHSKTNFSEVHVAQAALTKVSLKHDAGTFEKQVENHGHLIFHRFSGFIREGEALHVHKIVITKSNRDAAIGNIVVDAQRCALKVPNVDKIKHNHYLAWEAIWDRCDIKVDAKDSVQKLLRLHIFHLLQVASPNTLDMDVSVPSRGIHGEAYRGNLMWDEIYIFPVINYMKPSITKNMMKYRYYRMQEAKNLAKANGKEGAMFPWQSGSNGQENAQEIHSNPESGRWIPDDTHLQRHVNVAIAYNIWSYYKITKDQIFLEDYGAEMMFSISLFLASLTSFNEEKQRYEIKHVVGPDEYHTSYPDSDEPGLNNNAYTNIMVAWVLKQALKMHQELPDFVKKRLDNKLEISEETLHQWNNIANNIYVPFLEDGLIEQFEGYGQLKELDWEAYKEKYGNIQRLDRILESEDDSPNHYKVSKQADVLMLFYLFTSDELQEIFKQLHYSFEPTDIKKNIAYYEKRTSHGSTLSRLVYSWVMARAHRKMSWKFFEEALKSDFNDIQGGTTTEAIHLGAMAGTVDMVQRAYTGAYVDDEGVLWLNPSLPAEISTITLSLRYRGQSLYIHISNDKIHLRHEAGWADIISVGIKDEAHIYKLSIGESIIYAY